MASQKTPDVARRIAFDVLRQINGDGAYANLALAQALGRRGLEPRDAGFVTELVAGTCRAQGTYDRIIEAAAGRSLVSLQPAVVDLLRLGAHQALAMRLPTRAAVAATVELARATVGNRVTGLTNAVLRKVAARDLAAWRQELIGVGHEALGIETNHPEWIVDAYRDLLGDEAELALRANNVAPQSTLVVRPGLAEVAELGGRPTRFSPFGATIEGNPAQVPAVREGRAGVQDEGSQLVALALTKVPAPEGPWLDLCAGPGGKAALLAGLAPELLVAAEAQPHRAKLVANAFRAYGRERDLSVVAADGRHPAWGQAFARVLADVPCTGLGALRRRPEARWRRKPEDIADLRPLQVALLHTAIDSCRPGGAVAYVTCSPHRAETTEVVEQVLSDREVTALRASDYLDVPGAALGDYVQLWPHRQGTDAMFLALIRVDSLRA